MTKRIEVVHRKPDFWDRHRQTRRNVYTTLFLILLKYFFTITFIIMLIFMRTSFLQGEFSLKNIEGKIFFLFFLLISFAAIYSWYIDIHLLRKRRSKFGRNWKWGKDPLVKEFIGLVILVVIIFWFWSPSFLNFDFLNNVENSLKGYEGDTTKFSGISEEIEDKGIIVIGNALCSPHGVGTFHKTENELKINCNDPETDRLEWHFIYNFQEKRWIKEIK
jgi:hypothetical protein